MGTIERKQRLRDRTKKEILDAALTIVNNESWQALSMRKIAEIIEYTAPVIYEHFKNKEDILMELSKKGYQKLTHLMENAQKKQTDIPKKIEELWLAYWDFAFTDTELYKLMFGVNTACCNMQFADSEYPRELFQTILASSENYRHLSIEQIKAKYYSYWAMVHGHIAINIISKGEPEIIDKKVLLKELDTITKSMLN